MKFPIMVKLLIGVLGAIFLIAGCKKTEEDFTSSDADYYFFGRIKNKPVRYEVKSASKFIKFSSSSCENIPLLDTTKCSYEGGIFDSTSFVGFPVVSLRFQTIKYLPFQNEDSVFLDFFKIGSVNFATNADLGTDGIILAYRDKRGYDYHTEKHGVFLQPSSAYFNVLEVEKFAADTVLGTPAYVNVKAEMEANLFMDKEEPSGSGITIRGTCRFKIIKSN